ncbi:MAG TPA: CDP-glucose 4,6-dehydratase [Gammaproteobacteria bacterium]|nr:CDP-glucose 4,6-dehydratase [Gammaproteobacteria bacterium]
MGEQTGAMEDLVMNTTFWQDKKVFITGHTGFKGGWLSLWLHSLNAKVTGFALPPPTEPSLFSLANIENKLTSITGDIRDFSAVKQAMLDCQPDIIFHMAAQPIVRYSYHNPIETYATNVMGTVNVLEAARQTGFCKAFVNITSDKCYENKEWHWGYREEDRLGGHDPYSNSKACAELVTSAFRNSYCQSASQQFACGIASVRAGNVIGGGDWAEDRLIPDVMRGIFKNSPITLRYPQALRPWQHVLEPLLGYLQLAEKLFSDPHQYAEAWNFGPNEQDVRPVGWVVNYLLKLWDEKLSWHQDPNTNPHEASLLKLESAKAKKELRWHPRWNLEKALEITLDWYRSYHAGHDMYEKTLSQIYHYTNS